MLDVPVEVGPGQGRMTLMPTLYECAEDLSDFDRRKIVMLARSCIHVKLQSEEKINDDSPRPPLGN